MQKMPITIYWSTLLLLISCSATVVHASHLPCLKFNCPNELSPSADATCDDCSQCHANSRRFCLLSDDKCQCADSIPQSCIPKGENTSVEICYVPANSVLRILDMNTDDENSITVEVDRFWENEDEGLHFRNLTLNAIYAVKDLIDCTDHGRFTKAKVIENNLCFIKYRIPMPSIDYTSDDNYYYDDHQNPMVQFDRQIFDETVPLTFWHEVRARKLFRLPVNITVFFQYPMRSNNITYIIPTAKGQPTARSASESEFFLHDSENHDWSPDGSRNKPKTRNGNEDSLKYKLLTKFFTHMVLAFIAFVLLFALLCGISIWLCCVKEKTTKFSMTDSKRAHIMQRNSVGDALQ